MSHECKTCHGTGRVEYGEFGFDCVAMHNGGRMPDAPGTVICDDCHGTGVEPSANPVPEREPTLEEAYAEGRKDEREEMIRLLGWAYGKLSRFSYSKQEDALMLDEINLILLGAQ